MPERFAAARAAGFNAVEFLSPYDWPIAEIKAWLTQNKLQMILLNIATGDQGEVGTAATPGRQTFFRESFEQALTYASALNVEMIHVLSGRASKNCTPDRQLFVENIRWAADAAAGSGVTLNLEPLNTQDVPGYLHSTSGETVELIKEIGRSNVKLQFDFYHLQIMQGNLARSLEKHLEHISHVQFSSLPGRHEPEYGEVNVAPLFRHLDKIGYRGWVGCEYWPRNDTQSGLGWAAEYGIRQNS